MAEAKSAFRNKSCKWRDFHRFHQ